VGRCGADISNSSVCNKVNSIAPERLEITLFKNGRLAFTSPSSIDLRLKLKCSIMSASLGRGLLTSRLLEAAFHYRQSVASVETKVGSSNWLWGIPFLTAMAVPRFLPTKQSDR
jgi:hypothetical protein